LGRDAERRRRDAAGPYALTIPVKNRLGIQLPVRHTNTVER
jgi:hypothetical protein